MIKLFNQTTCQRATLIAALFCTAAAQASVISGTVVDATSKEPLIGATIRLDGTNIATSTDIDGAFSIDTRNGNYSLGVSYVGFSDLHISNVKLTDKGVNLVLEMQSDSHMLSEMEVIGYVDNEGAHRLNAERINSSRAIENLGAKEMSAKGLGNVAQGVKRISGISLGSTGQVIVRGLGDRYSITTLNGLPIASPNPDNKLIPLDIFPTSTVQNITVTKVFDASSFADYSGAHIDISTKENAGNDFFKVSLSAKGNSITTSKEMFQMNRDGSMLSNHQINQNIIDMERSDFDSYAKSHDIFNTSFQTSKHTALPTLGGSLGAGKQLKWDGNRLCILAAASASHEKQRIADAFIRTLEATGNTLSLYNYNRYDEELNLAALGNVALHLKSPHQFAYTFFYARNAIDSYFNRSGIDYEDHNLVGSNNVSHIYSLLDHQISGKHNLIPNLRLNWNASYCKSSSEEPDRRQVMFLNSPDGNLSLFKLNQQETMRYFGSLNEDEWVADINANYRLSKRTTLALGTNFKDKSRDYEGTRFYYNLGGLNPTVTSPFDTDGFLNFANVSNGNIVINRSKQPRGYDAGLRVYAAYVTGEFYPLSNLMLNLGLRYEKSEQWVNYFTDSGRSEHNDLNCDNLFPTINAKYSLGDTRCLRFGASRTITRPAFIEMAPFLYQETYGSAQIRGNAALQNGYNYNFDLRFEQISNNGDLMAATIYYKLLDSPIERIQSLSGGLAVHSFRNADTGTAAGVEIELRKKLSADLSAGLNGSYMYTDVKLPEGGVYTNNQRALQGASPVLGNADITYSPRFANGNQLSVALLYNLQGSRIHAVGISGLGDVKQCTTHTLNLNSSYTFGKNYTVRLAFGNLLNQDVVFRQEVPSQGKEFDVERYNKGIDMEIGFSYSI